VYVLDASAMLAVVYEEEGADEVLSRLSSSLILSINFAEVLQKAATAGRDPEQVGGLLRRMTMGVVPFDHTLASESAALWPLTRHAGLSLADRACLALAGAMGAVAVTADSSWARLSIPSVDVHLIR
jgi:PIN domain nuclease of toxin-antitoxin system